MCGNAAIAKTPTDGGFISLSLAFATARRCGLPVSLVNGAGGELSNVLVQHEAVDCLSFVGGRYNGRAIADALAQNHKRYLLEVEGVNYVWHLELQRLGRPGRPTQERLRLRQVALHGLRAVCGGAPPVSAIFENV